MDFNLSDLQRMLLDTAERYLAERFTLEHRRALRDTADGLDTEAWSTFAELGWLALAIPEAQGGLGGTMADIAVLGAALGYRCVALPFTSSAVIAPMILAESDAPQGGLLQAIAEGISRVALAHDEPDERYNYSAGRRTMLTDSGSGWTVTGQKMLVLDAPSATHLIVSAGGDDDFTLTLVPADAEGISSSPYPLLNGARAADIVLDEVAGGIPLARGRKARTLLANALDYGRIADAAQMVGSMEADLALCSAYLKERQQFGQPIGKFQALQHIMADMFVATHQARSILYSAIAAAEADEATRSRAVSLARINIAEAHQIVARQAIQLHGGYGITDEYEVSHHYRHQIVLEKLYGDVDFHERRLAAD
ncbi:MAG: acyl-CoA dehydrogenase family protein [Sphingomonadaceae bacterium]|nr:acyl-CoA dehydrogenase family protein [Sphingomonadaceae bacterium]